MLIVLESPSAAWWSDIVDLLWCRLLRNSLPDTINYLFVIQSFENSVTADQEKIKIIFQLEFCDFWLTHNHIHIPTILLPFCLNIAEGSRYWQPTREYPQRSLNIQVFLPWWCRSFCKCLSPVHFTTSCVDSLTFQVTVRLVVSRHHSNFETSIHRHYTPWIANICDVSNIIHHNHARRTRTWSFGSYLCTRILLLGFNLSLLNQL